MLLCLSLQVDKLTSQQVDELLVIKETPCSYVTLSLFAVDELDKFTSKQVACYKGKTCSYVTLSSFAITLLTCQLVNSSTYLVTLSLFVVDMSLRN